MEDLTLTAEEMHWEVPPMDDEFRALLTSPVEADLSDEPVGTWMAGTVVSSGFAGVVVELAGGQRVSCRPDESAPIGGTVPEVGATVTVFITGTTSDGHLSGSVATGALLAQYERLLQAGSGGLTVPGVVTHIARGGFFVYALGVRCFLPGRDSGVSRAMAPSMLGRELTFEVVRLSQDLEPILSRRSMARREQQTQRGEALSRLTVGDVVTGTVTSIQPFGAFVDLGGVDGLLHVSELTVESSDHPEQQVHVGDEIEVKIISIDEKKGRIALSRRELLVAQSQQELEKIATGSIIDVRITRLADFGAFAELLPGIEGLLHVSELSWTERVTHPSELVSVGQQLKVKVLSRDGGRISLSLRQTESDPWTTFAAENEAGAVLTGRVTRIESFGVFVELAPSIEGLCHISDLTWEGRPSTPADVHPWKVGDEIQVKLLQIDAGRRRASLGIKQLTTDPWDAAADLLVVGNVVDARIVRFDDHAAWARIGDAIDGRIHVSELSTERVDSIRAAVRFDQVVTVKVLTADRDRRRIDLSIKAAILDDLAASGTEYADQSAAPSLGDLLRNRGLLTEASAAAVTDAATADAGVAASETSADDAPAAKKARAPRKKKDVAAAASEDH